MDEYLLLEKADIFEKESILTSSQLEKLEVDETLSEIERAVKLLECDLVIQKQAVVNNIPYILSVDDPSAQLETLLYALKPILSGTEGNYDLVIGVLHGLSKLAYVTTSGNALDIPSLPDPLNHEFSLEKQNEISYLIDTENVARYLLTPLMDFIDDVQDKSLLYTVTTAIIGILPRLHNNSINQIIRKAIVLGEVSQTVENRLVCCRILGAILGFNLFSTLDVETLFLHKMLGLCQDTDSTIRVSMCRQLQYLSFALGNVITTRSILPEFLELLQDEEIEVKEAALDSMILSLDNFLELDRKEKVLPVLTDLVVNTPHSLTAAVTKQIGLLMIKLFELGDISSDGTCEFQRRYILLANSVEVEIRRLCAYNFPAVCHVVGAKQYASQLHETFHQLAHDPDIQVRATIIAGLHEVANELGKKLATVYLQDTLLDFLKCEDQEIQHLTMKNLSVLLTRLSLTDDDQTKTLLGSLLLASSRYGASIVPNHWRKQKEFVESIFDFPKWFSSIDILENFIPLLFQLLHQGVYAVQRASARTICWHARKLTSPGQRHLIMTRIRSDFGHGRSFWQRSLYLDICVFVLEFYSRHYFKQNFLEIAMKLLEDSVPNVRYKAVLLLPSLKATLSLPSDNKILERINRIEIVLQNDKDKEVAQALQSIKDQLEGFENYSNPCSYMKIEDIEDQRKMKEEEDMAKRHETEIGESLRADLRWLDVLDSTLNSGRDIPRLVNRNSIDAAKIKATKEISRTSISAIKFDNLKSAAPSKGKQFPNPSANNRTSSHSKMIVAPAKASIDPKGGLMKGLPCKNTNSKDWKEGVTTRFEVVNGNKTNSAPPKVPASPRIPILQSPGVSRTRPAVNEIKKDLTKVKSIPTSKRNYHSPL